MFFPSCLAEPLAFRGRCGGRHRSRRKQKRSSRQDFQVALPQAAKLHAFVAQMRFCSSNRTLRNTESKRPQRFSETLRIIDSAQMRMTKANMEKLDKLDAAVRKLGL
jgi:hypothetical protein